jgi:hypothetical protein
VKYCLAKYIKVSIAFGIHPRVGMGDGQVQLRSQGPRISDGGGLIWTNINAGGKEVNVLSSKGAVGTCLCCEWRSKK